VEPEEEEVVGLRSGRLSAQNEKLHQLIVDTVDDFMWLWRTSSTCLLKIPKTFAAVCCRQISK
jgi:hypothetical protein